MSKEWAKNGPKRLILAYFGPQMNVPVQNDHSILKPLLCLKFLQYLGQNNESFSYNCKSLQKIGILAIFSDLRLNFSQTEISTAKPMVVGGVQHYSTHFINKLGKSVEPFSHKVNKNANNGHKRQQIGPKMTILAFLLPFFHFWSIFIHFEKKNQNLLNYF